MCVKVSGPGALCEHVVAGTQFDNMRRMARARRGGGRPTIRGLGREARRARSVALREARPALGPPSARGGQPVHQGANLVDSWTSAPSRPRAVHERHRLAVQRGAPAVSAQLSTADRLIDDLRKLGRTDQDVPASGRRCAAYRKQAGQPCRRRVSIGANELADHCLHHLNAWERHRHETYQQTISSATPIASRDAELGEATRHDGSNTGRTRCAGSIS